MAPIEQYDSVKTPTTKLNSGYSIPLLGLGTWKSKAGDVEKAVKTSIRAGIRHIDTARAYGNEKEVGNAIRDILDEGVVKREELHVTTKLWNKDHGRVAEVAREQLKDLQLEYLDLYLMHWPVADNEGPTVDPPLKDTWAAMEKLVDEGLVRSIGISNFSIKKTKDLLTSARIKPAVNQVEVHPVWRNDALIDFCHSQGIHVTAYSPLGSPDSASLVNRDDNAPKVMQDDTVKSIADKLGKSPAQVLIRWAIQHGTSVIPKATSEDHIRSNLDVLNWELSQEDFKALSSLKQQVRLVDGSMFLKPKGPYKTVRDIWDDEVGAENPNN